MKRKITLFVCLLLMAAGAMAAGWEKPVPQNQEFMTNTELYLWNVEAEGFFRGANDWGTRASVDPSYGWKVMFSQASSDYYFQIFVEEGGFANQWAYIKIEGESAIWTDAAIDENNDHIVSVVQNGDGTFKLGPSVANQVFTPTDYDGCYLGGNPNMNDSKLYLVDKSNVTDAQINWYFVSATAYTTYIAKYKQYVAAVKLGELLSEASGMPGVDASAVSAAQTVYQNTSSSTEDLEAQYTALFNAMKNAASPSHPVEMLADQGIATDFNDGQWPGWESTTNAQNKQANNGNNAADFSVTGNHYENWNGSPMNPGKIYATATGLSKAVYRLDALAFANITGGTVLYAGNAQKMIQSLNIDINTPMSIYYVADGSLEVGLEILKQGPNWVGLDNVYLYNLGASSEAVELAKTATLSDYSDPEGEYAQATVSSAYDSAKSALQSASTIDALATALPTFTSAHVALTSSIAAYKKYAAKIDELEAYYNDHSSASGTGMDNLGDYVSLDDGPSAKFPNGCAHYILDNGTLNEEQIEAEIKFAEEVLGKAVEGSMSDGTDVTAVIKNPHFAEAGVWENANNNAEWPKGPEDYAVAEGYSKLFTVSQVINNLQNGLYELTLFDFFRPGGSNTNPQAYVYINDDRVAMNPADDGGDVPGDVNTAAEAFKNGRYAQHVYGIVTDGTMTIKLTNENRFEDDWACWSDLHMTFRAENPEVMATVTSASIDAANQLLSEKMGQEESSALNSAISAASANTFSALKALKNAMNTAKEGIEAYKNFNAALVNLSLTLDEYSTSSKAAEAQSLLSAADAAYSSGSLNTAAALAKIDELNAMATALKLGDFTGEPTEMTSVIVNNNMDPNKGSKDEQRIDGWVTTALNGYKLYTCSYNRAEYELYQDLSGLPKGKYKVTVHTYYRAGYYNEEVQHIANGEDTKLCKLYATTTEGTVDTPVMNLIDDAQNETYGVNCYTYEGDGRHAPDGTAPTAEWFAQGRYLNELEFTVPDDGKARIGLSKKGGFDNDYAVVGEWQLWYYGDDEEIRQDVSNLIVNNNMDPNKGSKDEQRIDGWVTTALNGYKLYTCSYNRAEYELYQDLSGLPAGIYEVTVHTYYRAGYYNEEVQHINNGENTKLCNLYATTTLGTDQVAVMNLIDDAQNETYGVNCYTYEGDGRHAPDGTAPTAEWFAQGRYLNTLQFVVPADGKARIGLSKKGGFDNDYAVVGEWNLYYLGSATGVDAVESKSAMPAGFYSLSGVRLDQPQRGINIIKMADGTVRKVLVK